MAPTICAACGVQVPEGAERCPSCATPFEREGFFWRLLRMRARRAAPTVSTRTITTEVRTDRIEVKDAQGRTRTYDSLEQVPPEVRAQIEQARRDAERGGGTTKITVNDASGVVRTYASLDEVPADLRALIDRAQHGKGS
jgi:hypothetical protein